MKKTSVYLSADDEARLERLAAWAGRSRTDIIRLALRCYEEQAKLDEGPREFALFNSARGDGRSIADFTDEEMAELMKGFGED